MGKPPYCTVPAMLADRSISVSAPSSIQFLSVSVFSVSLVIMWLVHLSERTRLHNCSSWFSVIFCLACNFQAGRHSAIGRAPDSKARGPGFDTWSGNILSFLLRLFSRRAVVSYWRKYVDEVLVYRLGGLSLPRLLLLLHCCFTSTVNI